MQYRAVARRAGPGASLAVSGGRAPLACARPLAGAVTRPRRRFWGSGFQVSLRRRFRVDCSSRYRRRYFGKMLVKHSSAKLRTWRIGCNARPNMAWLKSNAVCMSTFCRRTYLFHGAPFLCIFGSQTNPDNLFREEQSCVIGAALTCATMLIEAAAPSAWARIGSKEFAQG